LRSIACTYNLRLQGKSLPSDSSVHDKSLPSDSSVHALLTKSTHKIHSKSS